MACGFIVRSGTEKAGRRTTGTASGKRPGGVKRALTSSDREINVGAVSLRRAFPALILFVLFACRADAQAPGTATFRIYHRAMEIGSAEASLVRDDEGWRLQSSGRIDGPFKLTLRQFDARYDSSWRARFLTMEQATVAESSIVHVAVVGMRTRTDVVREKQAVVGSNNVAPHTIFLPDFVYGAYEALAARLVMSSPGETLPLFVAPRGEIYATLDVVADEPVKTAAGSLSIKRFELTAMRMEPTPIIVWVDRGRLLRVDLPAEEISVVRSDVIRE